MAGHRRGGLLVAALAGVLLAFPATAAEDEEPEKAGRMGPQTVLVKLQAWSLGFDEAEVEAGRITFRVENADKAPHSFAIKGDGVDKRPWQFIIPLESKTTAIELKPGTYTLYCPIEAHAEKGMKATLKVVAAE